ncbi:unnamed protein product (macronuclear) [Paramecium tetraurelia]|uniref:Uncharacterized protein n=1 Tax=Paramecium tetraurelia TaxID=5888 RepID=A0BGG7_PARTE|nr:uncharacterized protein GSPATT00028669001 [Paramecium tetraurelia]CAK57634.1 unnamed protein product [Paramecium tetraurelia]|eukprot:XP_001425032.1 hypothetical protein (macronuclear) [Paramecium tetraurelia strain d4-2]
MLRAREPLMLQNDRNKLQRNIYQQNNRFMLNKPELSKELSVFLELLHQDKEDYKGYENYLIGSDLDDMESKKVDQYGISQLSIVNLRAKYRLNETMPLLILGICFLQFLEIQKIKCILHCLSESNNYKQDGYLTQKINEFSLQNQSLETNNKLLVEALNSSQQEIQVLAASHEESSHKLKKSIQDLKKQCEELNKSLVYTQQINSNLLQQIDREQQSYKKNEEEFRDASQRLIKSNQALRYNIKFEIVKQLSIFGNISPMHKSKLQEVIKYLTEGRDTRQTELRSAHSQSRKQKENISLHYSTLNISSSKNKKSMSPQGFTSTRKQQGVNVLDINYQISYKELFLKSLKVTKQK